MLYQAFSVPARLTSETNSLFLADPVYRLELSQGAMQADHDACSQTGSSCLACSKQRARP
jgi:hypothetical protein